CFFCLAMFFFLFFFFFQAEDGIRDFHVTGVQTCALPISFGHVACSGEGLEHTRVYRRKSCGYRATGLSSVLYWCWAWRVPASTTVRAPHRRKMTRRFGSC